MRFVSIRLCVCLAAICLLALAGLGAAWGCSRLDTSLTEKALAGFVTATMARARAGQWQEVRSAASRDALEALERHGTEWTRRAGFQARSLGSGAWIAWVEVPRGSRYCLQADEITWRPLAPPWRRRHFRLTSFEKIA